MNLCFRHGHSYMPLWFHHEHSYMFCNGFHLRFLHEHLYMFYKNNPMRCTFGSVTNIHICCNGFQRLLGWFGDVVTIICRYNYVLCMGSLALVLNMHLLFQMFRWWVGDVLVIYPHTMLMVYANGPPHIFAHAVVPFAREVVELRIETAPIRPPKNKHNMCGHSVLG